jgi:hypothetical protein
MVGEADADGPRDEAPTTSQQRRTELFNIWMVLTQRRTSFHSALWQTPALSVTAQSFVLTIQLGPETTIFARSLAAIIGIVIGIVTLQIILRHRHMEMYDWLEAAWMEEQLGLNELLQGVIPHGDHPRKIDGLPLRYQESTSRRADRRGLWLDRQPFKWLRDRISLHAWIVVQGAFILVSAAVLALTLLGHADLFGQPSAR